MNNNKLFYEWLAGQIDGDGNFALHRTIRLIKITTHPLDLKMFQYINVTLGVGYIYKRPNENCLDYKFGRTVDIIVLLNKLNGLIYNSVKFKSFSKMCVYFGIIPIPAPIPRYLSPYYAGFFDADGTTGVYLTASGYPSLIISVKNKYKEDVLPYQLTFGGKIYEDKGKSFKWIIHDRVEILAFVNYAQLGYFQSFKSTKLLLIEEYYELKDLKAWKPDSIHYPRWLIHYAKWCRKGYDD